MDFSYTILPKGFTTLLIFFYVMLQGCRVTLAKTVDVHNGHQVVKLVVGGKWHGLPDSPLWHLTIPQQTEDTVTGEQAKITWLYCAYCICVLCLCRWGWCVVDVRKKKSYLRKTPFQSGLFYRHYLTPGWVISCDVFKLPEGWDVTT